VLLLLLLQPLQGAGFQVLIPLLRCPQLMCNASQPLLLLLQVCLCQRQLLRHLEH
jgi:hypothetical protein